MAQDVVRTFVSASFADEAQPTVDWFLQVARKMGLEPVWLRQRHAARPIKEKIKEAMRTCPAFVQIWTLDLKGTPREFGTMKEEYAWFDEIRKDGSLAVFVEKGVSITGQLKYDTEPLEFDSTRLHAAAPSVIECLEDLRTRAISRSRRERDPSEVRIGVLHGTEGWGQCEPRYADAGPDAWEEALAKARFQVQRLSVEQIDTAGGGFDAILNPFGEAYPEEDAKSETTLTRIAAYIDHGGVFVCTDGWPFYHAFSPQGWDSDDTRLKRFFSIDVTGGQVWPDYEAVVQTAGSVEKYGELAHKGDDFNVHVWRPVSEQYGVVEKVLVSTHRNGIVLGFLPRGRGGLIVTGMHLKSPGESGKLLAFVIALLTRRK